ncbi:MAG: glycine zipper family protein, partial [Steroidobacteraceae bacterium]
MSALWTFRRGLRLATAGVVLAALSACATTQYDQPVAYNAPPPNTTVYAYPMHGQSTERQSRDRYECSVWAVHQSGFDPSAPNVPVYDRVAVQGPPPGTDTALGAIAGAVIGAALSDRWDRGS